MRPLATPKMALVLAGLALLSVASVAYAGDRVHRSFSVINPPPYAIYPPPVTYAPQPPASVYSPTPNYVQPPVIVAPAPLMDYGKAQHHRDDHQRPHHRHFRDGDRHDHRRW